MYEIIKTFLFYTSKGQIIAYLDENYDFHVMSENVEIIKEVTEKYYRRKDQINVLQ